MTRLVRILDSTIDSEGRSLVCNEDDSPGGRKEKAYEVANPHNIRLKKDDIVEIDIPPGRTFLITARLFLLPLALFLTGYMFAVKLYPNIMLTEGLGLTRDELAFLVGLAAMLLPPLLFLMIQPHLGKSRQYRLRNLPSIIRKVPTKNPCFHKAESPDGCGTCSFCASTE